MKQPKNSPTAKQLNSLLEDFSEKFEGLMPPVIKKLNQATFDKSLKIVIEDFEETTNLDTMTDNKRIDLVSKIFNGMEKAAKNLLNEVK